MFTTMNIILSAIFAWRLTYMLMSEDGPYNIFLKLRDWANITEDGYYVIEAGKYSLAGELLTCYYCLSMYTGTLAAILLYLNLTWIMIPFVLSAFVILLSKAHDYINGVK